MIRVKCSKCGYEWNYKGKRDRYATCPNCKSSVKLTQASKEAGAGRT